MSSESELKMCDVCGAPATDIIWSRNNGNEVAIMCLCESCAQRFVSSVQHALESIMISDLALMIDDDLVDANIMTLSGWPGNDFVVALNRPIPQRLLSGKKTWRFLLSPGLKEVFGIEARSVQESVDGRDGMLYWIYGISGHLARPN